MKKLLSEYANYNYVANERIGAALKKLTSEQLNFEQRSSFTSIRKTAEHLADCEYNWMKRINGDSNWEFKAKTFETTDKLVEFWLQQSKAFVDLIEQSDDKKLEAIMQYKNIKGEEFKNELYKSIIHLFNHSTYHRGQLVTLMRGAGFTEIPNTDLIAYYRRPATV